MAPRWERIDAVLAFDGCLRSIKEGAVMLARHWHKSVYEDENGANRLGVPLEKVGEGGWSGRWN
jgi:hypothetical protein